MSVDRLPGGGASPKDSVQVTRIENSSVGFTPEALTRRVTNALGKVHLTGVEGEVFGRLFSLIIQEENTGFLLQSPPRERPWESGDNFIPDFRAQVSLPWEMLPNGQILWMDRSNIWGPRDEIANGQKISMVLDALLGPLEAARISTESTEHRELISDGKQSPE